MTVASDGGRLSTAVSDSGERIDGGRESTEATAVTTTDTTAAAATTVTRFKRSENQTHYFSTLDGICWTTF